jgi:hypothetical protein
MKERKLTLCKEYGIIFGPRQSIVVVIRGNFLNKVIQHQAGTIVLFCLTNSLIRFNPDKSS